VWYECAVRCGREPPGKQPARDALLSPRSAERQFTARRSAYRDALAARASAATTARLGQTLFAFAGGSFRQIDEHILRGGELLGQYLTEANGALRDIFGKASLPENVPPSAMTRRA